jgi:hypothetical protein
MAQQPDEQFLQKKLSILPGMASLAQQGREPASKG